MLIYRNIRFFKEGVDISKHKILFEDRKIENEDIQLKFNGYPFVILGTRYLECTHGKDQKESAKKKKNNMQSIKTLFRNHGSYHRTQKKVGCSARILMRDVVFFPGYIAESNTEKRKRTISEKLRKDYNNDPSCVNYVRSIYLRYPEVNSHSKHILGEMAGFSETIDKDVSSKIKQLVGEGVSNVREMQRHLRIFVKK